MMGIERMAMNKTRFYEIIQAHKKGEDLSVFVPTNNPEAELINNLEGGSGGSATVNIYGGVQLVSDPNTPVNKIYFNTALNVDEVVAILSQLTYTDIEGQGGGYLAFSTEDMSVSVSIMRMGDIYVIFGSDTMFASADIGEGFVGWNTSVENYMEVGGLTGITSATMDALTMSIGAENNLLTNLILADGGFNPVEISLQGKYDGTPITIGKKIDMEEYFNQKKIPLTINLAQEYYGKIYKRGNEYIKISSNSIEYISNDHSPSSGTTAGHEYMYNYYELITPDFIIRYENFGINAIIKRTNGSGPKFFCVTDDPSVFEISLGSRTHNMTDKKLIKAEKRDKKFTIKDDKLEEILLSSGQSSGTWELLEDVSEWNNLVLEKGYPNAPEGVDWLVGTTWVFNDTIKDPNDGAGIVTKIGFTSNGTNYNSFYYENLAVNAISYDITNNVENVVYNVETDTWVNDVYKTITITDTSNITDDSNREAFIKFLTANATKQ